MFGNSYPHSVFTIGEDVHHRTWRYLRRGLLSANIGSVRLRDEPTPEQEGQLLEEPERALPNSYPGLNRTSKWHQQLASIHSSNPFTSLPLPADSIGPLLSHLTSIRLWRMRRRTEANNCSFQERPSLLNVKSSRYKLGPISGSIYKPTCKYNVAAWLTFSLLFNIIFWLCYKVTLYFFVFIFSHPVHPNVDQEFVLPLPIDLNKWFIWLPVFCNEFLVKGGVPKPKIPEFLNVLS